MKGSRMQKELRSRVSAVPEGEKGCKKKELEIFYHEAREERREKLRERERESGK